MKRATAYRRRGQIFIHTSSRTTDGVWMLDGSCVKLEDTSSDRELGEAARAAVDASRTGIPHPKAWAGLLDPLLRLAGVKTWGAFAKDAACSELEAEGGKVSVIPTRNLGVDEGFQPVPARAQIVDLEATESLGACLRQTLLS